MNILGDGDGDATAATTLSAPQATAYAAAASIAPGDRTPTQQAIVDAGDQVLAAVAADWNAIQQAVAAEVMTFATSLQADLQRTVRQNMRRGWSEGAISEMLSVITARLVTQHRLLLELRERLDASPY